MESRVVLDALSPPPPLFVASIAKYVPTEEHFARGGVGDTLRQSIRRNFPPLARLPRISPEMCSRIIKVESLPELQRAILYARGQRRSVRAGVSGGKGIENLKFLEEGGVLVNMSMLTKVGINRSRGVVVVQAGCLLKELELGMEEVTGVSGRVNLGACRGARSIGGGVVRGVLGGGGVVEGVLGDAVVEISFVDAFGRLRVVSEGTEGSIMKALKLSLGVFGVVYDVSLRIDTFRRVARVKSLFLPMRGLVGGTMPKMIKGIIEGSGGVEITWIPFNSWMKRGVGWTPEEDVCWVRTLERVVEGGGKPIVELDEEQDVVFRFLTVPQWLSLSAGVLGREGYHEYYPEHVKVYLGLGFEETAWKLETKPYIQSYAHAVRYQDNLEDFPVVAVTVAFPMKVGGDEDWDVVQDAWKVVMRKVAECDVKKEYPLNVGMKTSFVKASDALLAPNFSYAGRGRRTACSAVVRIVSAKNTVGWERFAKEVVEEWMRLPGSRCQLSRELAKVCSPEAVVKNLGESLQNFKALRKNAVVDDYGMFLDEPFAEFLGLAGQRSEFNSSPVSSTGSGIRLSLRLQEIDRLFAINGVHIDYDGLDVQSWTGGDPERKNVQGGTPSVVISQSSLPWAPSSQTPKLFVSPVVSRTSLFEDTDAQGSVGGYDGDNDGSGDDTDDVSLESNGVGQIAPIPVKLRRPARRKKSAVYQESLSSPEYSLLYTYIALYVMLWLALFGESAMQRFGWIS